MPGNESKFSAAIAGDGFIHQYVIRAEEARSESESWSNPSIVELRHSITVPNIFTPNGDQFNQFFYIRKIELFTNSDLRVVDRWGVTVFEAISYQNNWRGEGLSSGVYYYMLDLKRLNQKLPGTIHILK